MGAMPAAEAQTRTDVSAIVSTTPVELAAPIALPAVTPYMDPTLARDRVTSASMPDVETLEDRIPKQTRDLLGIDLPRVAARAICRNLSIKIKDLDMRIAHDEFHAQQGIFDLKIGAKISRNRVENLSNVESTPMGGGQTDVTVNNSRLDTKTAEVSLSQLLPTGGTLDLLFSDSKNHTNTTGLASPFYNSSLGFNFRQPLLKNGGFLVTQANIVIAEYNSYATVAQYKQQIIETVSTAMQQYFDLMFAVGTVDVVRISLEQAKELFRINKAKLDAGVLPELDVLQAQSEVASRVKDMITALQNVEDASDRLKTQLAEICDLGNVTLRPLNLPEVPTYNVSSKNAVDVALTERPEFEVLRWSAETKNINIAVAKNQTLPQLDFFANYAGAGTARGNSSAVGRAADRQGINSAVGLEFSYPLQNRFANYRYWEALKSRDEVALMNQQLRDEIVRQVQFAERELDADRIKIDVGKAVVQFNIAKVETGQARQQAGLATSFDVLQFQRDLAQARLDLLRNITDYNKSIIQVEQSRGTLLKRIGVDVVDGIAVQAGKSKIKAATRKTLDPAMQLPTPEKVSNN